MFRYMKYGPYICIGVVLAILFVLWAFWGGKNYEFVGLAPLSPETCGSYTGSFYNWGNITPATGYDPIEGHNCVPPDTACTQDIINTTSQRSYDNSNTSHQIVIDNTPSIPEQFRDFKKDTVSTHLDSSNISGINSFNDTNSLLPSLRSQAAAMAEFSIPEQTICPQEPDEKFQSSTKEQGQVPLILDYNPTNVSRRSSNNPENVDSTIFKVSGADNENSKTFNNSLVPIFLPQPRNSTNYRSFRSKGNTLSSGSNQRGRFISRGERMCCNTMERIYGVPFTSTWPDWLRNPETGETLELDCYNDDLKIAVEYNGEQHYKWPNFTNQTYQQFINQVRRDTLKLDLCDKNGVYLIVVPYNVPYENIPSYVMSHLPETIQKRLQEERTLSGI